MPNEPLIHIMDYLTSHWPGMIWWMPPANERRSYNVTSSLIAWVHTQNDPCWHSQSVHSIAVLGSGWESRNNHSSTLLHITGHLEGIHWWLIDSPHKGSVVWKLQELRCNGTTWQQLFTERVTGLILGLPTANERRRYKVTPSLIGWAQTQNQPWGQQYGKEPVSYNILTTTTGNVHAIIWTNAS